MDTLRHILSSQQFDQTFINNIFKMTDSMQGYRGGDLSGKIVATLFYEPSTRTRLSFESAMTRLGGGIITTENARVFSSAAKGETLEDSIRIISKYADAIILRHDEAGAAERASYVSTVPIINAGDGIGQHPTQALLDLYTIWREFGNIDGVSVMFVGDLKHGRTVRSLVYLLGKYPGVRLTFVSPYELRIGDDILAYLDRHDIQYSIESNIEESIGSVDVVYQTRIQKERFESAEAYERNNKLYIITQTLSDQMKEGAIIMHPLPRVNELLPEVDSSPHARYFEQAANGLPLRMALLKYVLQ